MNRFTLIFMFFTFIFCSIIKGQDVGLNDKLSQERAEKIMNTCLQAEIKDKNYLLFSNGDIAYLIIIEEDSCYKEHFMYVDSVQHIKTQKSICLNKPYGILETAFDTSIYHHDFINFNSEFYKNGYTKAWGNYTYFVYKTKEGKTYGECRLSVIVEPNPINTDLYSYLQTRLTNYLTETSPSTKKKSRNNR